MPKNVKETNQPKSDQLGRNRLAPAGQIPANMKYCSNCKEPIMQGNNSCPACGAYQVDKSSYRG